MNNDSVMTILSLGAFSLLVLVSVGTLYLTLSGWRDRRRRETENRAR
jgi:hypothetical protein